MYRSSTAPERILCFNCLMQWKSVNSTNAAEMKSSKKVEIVNRSALVSLKAELSKKQEEARQAKYRANGVAIIPTPVPKKLSEYSKKNRGVDERNQKDAEEVQKEEAFHRNSRAALEEKAKLYDKLSQGREVIDSENESKFLVNFEQKIVEENNKNISDEKEESLHSDDYDNPSDPEDDWVDYRDCLGRTRRCLRRDLQFVKSKDKKLGDSLGMGDVKPNLEQERKAPPVEPEKPAVKENLELLSEDMNREALRKKWEQQEAELMEKSDVHYQDVLFDEVRTHGVAYYAFSREEKARQAEQEELQKLRSETVKGQAAAAELRARRKEQMAARLKAARARKRAREGLPPEPEENEETSDKGEAAVDETVTMWPDCKVAEKAKAEEEERERKRAKIEEAEEKRKKKPFPVRPWDIGKKGVITESQSPMSQEEWVKKKREERQAEFAPPPEFKQPQGDSHFADYVSTDSGWNASHLRATTRKLRDGSLNNSRKVNVPVKPVQTEGIPHSSLNYSGETDKEGLKSRKIAEIPPPATFDYYGPSSSKPNLQQVSGSNLQSHASLDDAITAGLHYLRQQAEERKKQKEKGLLGII